MKKNSFMEMMSRNAKQAAVDPAKVLRRGTPVFVASAQDGMVLAAANKKSN